MFCSSVGGSGSSGFRQCVGVGTGPSATAGGSVSFPWTLRIDGNTASDATVTGYLPACETYDIEWSTPFLGLFLGAMVVVLLAKWIARPFTHDRYTA